MTQVNIIRNYFMIYSFCTATQIVSIKTIIICVFGEQLSSNFIVDKLFNNSWWFTILWLENIKLWCLLKWTIVHNRSHFSFNLYFINFTQMPKKKQKRFFCGPNITHNAASTPLPPACKFKPYILSSSSTNIHLKPNVSL